MKITAIETLRTEEFSNVLWIRVHTDSGIIGLGETFYGAGAVEAHIHDTLAGRLLGRNPLQIEAIHRDMVNLPMAQSSTGAEVLSAFGAKHNSLYVRSIEEAPHLVFLPQS